MTEVRGKVEKGNPASPTAEVRHETVQMTLSAIGDVGVAGDEAIRRVNEAPKVSLWWPTVTFFLVLYALSVVVAVLTFKSSLLVRLLLTPLFVVLCATAAFWWRQRWKARAKECLFKLKVWQDALVGLGHETVNATNAIRGNLISFRSMNPQAKGIEHLDIIEEGIRRIESIVQKAQDPIAWKGNKKKKVKVVEPAKLGEAARSKIS